MGLAAERLIDWRAARAVGARTAGSGPLLDGLQRARMREDFADVVTEADARVQDFTGLRVSGYAARPWVMTRAEWLQANLRAFQSVIEPFAQKVATKASEGALASVRRATLGAQVGALLGYMGRRVLGQYDVFLPPDDDGLLYFVGANIASVERRYGFKERDFRLWIALHEVTHRVQFGAVTWLRGYIGDLTSSYLSSMEVDAREMLERVRRAVHQVRAGEVEWRGLGWVFLLMTPDQKDTFRRMQAVMALLEGHGNYVMNGVGRGTIPDAPVFQRRLAERRRSAGLERGLQRAIGFDVKARQYDIGERFVAQAVDRSGMEGFNRVWERATNLPTLEEISRPDAWVARVAAA
jgi:coenzyme F420 biosynthesis associated uncharacterized protein